MRAARLEGEELVDRAAGPAEHELGVAVGLVAAAAAHVVLGQHEGRQGLCPTGGLVGAGSLGGTLEVAAAPAHLGKVGHGFTVKRAGSGHLLQRRARQRQQTAAQMQPSQARVG